MITKNLEIIERNYTIWDCNLTFIQLDKEEKITGAFNLKKHEEYHIARAIKSYPFTIATWLQSSWHESRLKTIRADLIRFDLGEEEEDESDLFSTFVSQAIKQNYYFLFKKGILFKINNDIVRFT